MPGSNSILWKITQKEKQKKNTEKKQNRNGRKKPERQTEHSDQSGRRRGGQNGAQPDRQTGKQNGRPRTRRGGGRQQQARQKESMRIIPLGGLKEIGKNITLLEYKNDILIIDCGFSFPEDEMFGIDVVIPDFTYLRENMEKIRGLIITHGHEDHIGGVPYLLKEINVPIYGSALAVGLIKNKLREFSLKADCTVINAGDTFRLGSFSIEAIRTNHSIADSMAFSIKCPAGHIVHTGDFKIDYSPLDGKRIDLSRFAKLGDEGVDVMMCDSTNVLRQGYTPSEK